MFKTKNVYNGQNMNLPLETCTEKTDYKEETYWLSGKNWSK